MIQQTSLEAYHNLKKEHKTYTRQKIVLETLKKLVKASDREIATYLGKAERNYISPRRTELCKANKIECVGKRPCTITGRNVMIWGIKDGEKTSSQN